MKNKLPILTVLACLLLSGAANAQTDSVLVREHLSAITKTDGYRNYKNLKVLNHVAEYIRDEFAKYADTTFYQEYDVRGVTYKNVVCRFGSSLDRPVMVVGAHYDVCGDQEGADDNASAVVALLEVARMLEGKTLSRPLELVAYTLEEPPFFRTAHMGSYVHARSLKRAGVQVYGMVAIEMIGYFSDEKWSQDYPVKVMKVAYGTRGNYILLLKRSGYGQFVKAFSEQFGNAESRVETRNLKAPAKMQGVDFSDHMNYWNAGYDALMVTNTSFFRNKNYHQTTDTMETLNIPKMCEVINSICHAILNIDKPAMTGKTALKK